MAISTDAVGKTYAPSHVRRRPREDPRVRARRRRDEPAAPRRRAGRARKGYRDLVAPPMFCVVYCGAALGPAMFDPEVGIDFARLLHSAQEFRWGPLVVAGDEIATTMTRQGHLRPRRDGLLHVRVGLHQPGRRHGVRRHLVEHRPRSVSAMQPGDEIPTVTVTPDKYLTVRYAGASGDFNPIHIDDDFAHQVGLPGQDPPRPVDDGAGRPGADRGRRRPARAQAPQRARSAAWASPRPRSR